MPPRIEGLVRRGLFQCHWLLGILAGSLLIVIGLSGAILSFEDEILDVWGTGVRQVARSSRPALTPPQLLAALPALPPGQALGTLVFSADPARSVRVQIQAASEGEGRQPRYADPQTGAWLGVAPGEAFFNTVERLHRYLLLPREPGRQVTGVLVLALLLLMASGLYLRWPAEAGRLRAWFGLKLPLRGRPGVWSLHAVVATWALPAWLILVATGLYWSFDVVRDRVDTWAGVPPRAQRMKAEVPTLPPPHPDITLAWQRFSTTVPSWQELRLRLPARSGDALEIQWLAPDAPHARARNRMRIDLDGQLRQDERFADLPTGQQARAAIYPLHVGSYFGLPGRIVMALASLALPLLGATGWWLYLQRRRQGKAAGALRRSLTSSEAGGEAILVAWASQTGRAEALALRTAQALQAAGCRVTLSPLAAMQPADLRAHPQALFVVSTAGTGQAPDMARGFAAALEESPAQFEALRFAVLALGNQQYPQFCAFGRRLHARLVALGASPLQGAVSACDSEPEALAGWFHSLARWGASPDAAVDTPGAHAWASWCLSRRRLLNPDSAGAPLYELTLTPADGKAVPEWAPGALAELRLPSSSPGGQASLPRRYSVASLSSSGAVQLVVRQHRHANGLGLASGYLTEGCPLGANVQLRLLANPVFRVTGKTQPCIFIGNGSGIAGLLGLIRERIRQGLGDNWLVFGERNRASDTLFADELGEWAAAGLLRVDRVFSRDLEGCYVQDHLQAQGDGLRAWLDRGAVLFVCGSAESMGVGVEAVLVELLGRSGLDALRAEGRYLRDVY